jgi:polysaccharide chain length determinant protein (PEP-CTERM system associated)
MAADYELTLNDYLEILRRRIIQIVGAFSVVMIVALAFALLLPPVFESTGTIMIESQQIPTDLVAASVNSLAAERISVVQQRVMTRENLQKLIDKYHLFKEERKNLTGSELIDKFRDSISVEFVNSDSGAAGGPKKGQATIAFTVAVDYFEAELAYRVANDLVTLFLDENVKSRSERATETTEFLTQEVARQKAALEKAESLVAAYKQQHGSALPEQMTLQTSMLQRAEDDLRSVERDYQMTQDELRFLDVDLNAAKSMSDPRSPSAVVSQLSELDKLKAEYAKLLGTYTENHPSVRALKRKIEQFEKAGEPSVTPANDKPSSNLALSPEAAKIQAKIDIGKAKLSALGQQQARLRAQIGQAERQLSQVPQVELGLASLLRDHEVAQKKYDEVVAKLTNAKISENLEHENKAERFVLLEPPQLPDKPIKPNRIKIGVMGFFLAIAAGLGFAMLLETLNERVRGVEAVALILKQRPMVAIPYITTQSELGRSNNRSKYYAAGVVIMLCVALAVVHYFFIPLDLLLTKIQVKLM